MRRVALIYLFLLIWGSFFMISCKKTKNSSVKPLVVNTDTTVHPNFVNSKYNFRVWFPKKPTQMPDTMVVDSIPIVYTTYFLDLRDSFYMLTVVNYPKEITQVIKPGQILLNGHHRAILTQGLTSDYEYLDTTTHKYPVLYYKVHSNQFKMVGMNLFRDSTMFQLFLVNVKSYPSQQTINRFLGSFQFLDKNSN